MTTVLCLSEDQSHFSFQGRGDRGEGGGLLVTVQRPGTLLNTSQGDPDHHSASSHGLMGTQGGDQMGGNP